MTALERGLYLACSGMFSPADNTDPVGEAKSSAVLHTADTNYLKLTDDALCEIYYILADVDPPWGRSLGWIRLTHVCRQWRLVGINLAALWARITCAFPPNIKTVLERTNNAPLVINLTYHNRSSYVWSSADLLALPVNRARVYTDENRPIERSQPLTLRTWDELFAGRAFPDLEKLSLHTFDSEYNFERADEELDAPVLAELDMDVPRQVIAPSLKTLRCGYETIWRWNIILNFIRPFALLENLSIICAYDDIEALGEDSWRREKNQKIVTALLQGAPKPSLVQLPRLTSLTIDVYTDGAYELLKHLDLPACTVLKVGTRERGDLWAQLLSRPEIIYPARKAMSVLLKDEGEYDDHYYTWWLHFTEKHVWLPASDVPGVRGSVSTTSGSRHLANFLNAIPDAVVSEIQELAFGHEDRVGHSSSEPSDSIRWLSTLKRFSRVAVLHFYCFNHRVYPHPDMDSLFPELHTVVVTFSGPHWPAQDIWWDRLRELLAARKASGRPVAQLVIRGDALCHRQCPDAKQSYTRGSRGGRAIKTVSDEVKGVDPWGRAAYCLQRRRIAFKAEAQLVGEVVDERSVEECSCLRQCHDYPR